MSYQERLEEIRQRFLTSIPDRLCDIESALKAASASEPRSRAEPIAAELHRRCHDLAGSSSMLGAHALGAAAHEMMDASREASLAGRSMSRPEMDAIAAGLDKLRAAAAILRVGMKEA